jgi:hypothetical protein|tara:strand:+ start:4493 stop:4699 length:207 start_codon:yes stop_codon:yes gene_type:complete
MDNHLTIVSLLLALFFMMWFAWDQNELVKQQNKEIRVLQQQVLFHNLFTNQIYRNNNQKSYNNPFNQQ